MDAVTHLLRRRAKRGAFAASPHFAIPDPIPDQNETRAIQAAALRKRLTPAEIEAMQASARSSAIRAASEAAAKAATTATTRTTQRVATPVAQAATMSTHTAWVFSDKFGNAVTSTTTARGATTSSAVRAVTSSTSTSARAASSSSTSSSTVKSSSSTTSTSKSTAAPLTSTATVRTITQSPNNVAASSSSAPSVSSDANLANTNSTKDTGLSGGTLAGIIIGVLVGLVVVGSLIGWLYRKNKNRSDSEKAPWAKIDDDDVTPFPPNEKYRQDDIYGASPAPVIGSRRALAMARQNAFQEDGSFRPASDYMFTEEGPNRAGVGSGSLAQGYIAYPNLPSPYYGLDPQGRPFHPDADLSPMPHVYNNVAPHSPHAITAPGNSRQLVGPHGFPQPELSPHALGRPAAPVSNFAIAQHEDFADMPEPHTPTNVDHGDLPYTPRTAMSAGEWAGDARLPQDRSRVSMSTPKAMGAGEAAALAAATAAARGPFPDEKPFPVAQPTPAELPSFEPMSPLMGEFDLKRSSSQPLAMYEDERSQQKRMYGEVASAANVPEPPTPKSAVNVTQSTGSTETGSSFSATEPMPARLPPAIAVQPPQPYIHGRPLSPLTEVQTPMSVATRPSVDYPVPSSSLLHEHNPYERTLLAAKAVPGSPAPPYSATSTGAASIPSPAYPPRSASTMSVPGSVTDSPQQYGRSEPQGTRVQSMFDEEDAYGGI